LKDNYKVEDYSVPKRIYQELQSFLTFKAASRPGQDLPYTAWSFIDSLLLFQKKRKEGGVWKFPKEQRIVTSVSSTAARN
jgi:hypothetical protein